MKLRFVSELSILDLQATKPLSTEDQLCGGFWRWCGVPRLYELF